MRDCDLFLCDGGTRLVKSPQTRPNHRASMAERIVVSLHLRAADASSSGYLRRALAAKKRAEALGATLSAWGADSFAFDFGAEEVEEAVDLALATFDDPALAEPRFSAGVAYGEL